MSIRLIFLDIDGVLNSAQSSYMHTQTPWCTLPKEPWCPMAVSNLQFLLAEFPDARIVVSSTWRANMEEVKEYFAKSGLPWDRVIGKTPLFYGLKDDGVEYNRGDEILDWLVEHGTSKSGSLLMPEFDVRDFVILDDDSDMGPLRKNHLYLTDYRNGLTWSVVEAIYNRFHGRQPLVSVKEEIPNVAGPTD